jgi:hypothetical protein
MKKIQPTTTRWITIKDSVKTMNFYGGGARAVRGWLFHTFMGRVLIAVLRAGLVRDKKKCFPFTAREK